MGVYFGTDGIRGIVNQDLDFELAYKCGNAIGESKERCKVIVGGDTRKTREYLSVAVAGGIMSAGGNVVDIGTSFLPYSDR